LWLVKHKDWIVAVAYIGVISSAEARERMVQTLLDRDNNHFMAAALSDISGTDYAPILEIPSTVEGILDFMCDYFSWWWYVFFAGSPDWFILPARTLDFVLVGGEPEFVRQILGCEPEEAAVEIREMSESEYLDPAVCRYYAYLLQQTQVVYPQAEPGTRINLGLIQRDED
jgi:hypothetical protein